MAITIFPDKTSYNPGEEVRAKVRIELEKPVKVRGAYVSLFCYEKMKKSITRALTLSEIQEKRNLGLYVEVPYVKEESIEDYSRVIEEKKISDEAMMQSVECEVSLRLPNDAKPTSLEFGHDNAVVQWFVQVRLDIPWALDIHGSREIFVAGL